MSMALTRLPLPALGMVALLTGLGTSLWSVALGLTDFQCGSEEE